MDFYAILGIPPDADEETIRAAYRILAQRYHPDKGAGSSTEKFRQIVEAYETLIDARRRLGYDRSLGRLHSGFDVSAEPRIGGPFRPEDPAVFGHFEINARSRSVRPTSEVEEWLDEWQRCWDSIDDLF